MIDQFRDRLTDIKSALPAKDKLLSLKWSMGQMKDLLAEQEKSAVAALDKWHDDESTDPKPELVDNSAVKAAIDKSITSIDSAIASIDALAGQLDKAAEALNV